MVVVVWYISISRPHPPKGSAKEAATLLQVVPYIFDWSSYMRKHFPCLILNTRLSTIVIENSEHTVHHHHLRCHR